jgi:hypothetical protein
MNAMSIAPTHMIADPSAMSIFVMAGTPTTNLCLVDKPINISLPDGKRITSTQICDITIPGLPQIFTGHIVPAMKMVSLLGIWVLCNAGYKVIFDDEKCCVNFNGHTILTSYKDPTSNLWMLLILLGDKGLWTTPRLDSTPS